MSATLLDLPAAATTTSQRGRVLLIAYSFPPVGGAGVQRPVKWVKYLQRSGWDVTVLTPANPSVPVIDESLLREVPPETHFIRPATWEPDYRVKQQLAGKANSNSAQHGWHPGRWIKGLIRAAIKLGLQPDPQILWYPNAVSAATQTLRSVRHDAILCTAPPYSSFLIGRTLKRRFGLPLILDYRDEWDLSSRYLEHAARDRWSGFIQERQQSAVLRSADAVLATTQASIDHIQQRLDRLQHTARTACIYNGYDAEDFETDSSAPAVESKSPECFRLVYTGTLWNLTDVAPLVTAIERLQQLAPALAARLEFVSVGRKTPDQLAILQRLADTGCRWINRDYCEHAEVLSWLQSADALCLLLSDVPGAERVVPAKLFEYLAAHKELLAIVPAGEAATLVERCSSTSRFAPQNSGDICTWLIDRLQHGSRIPTEHEGAAIDEFSRERQTAQLVELLDDLTTAARRKGR